ncbi:MAG: hypothetical protein HWD85_07735 [Flavobacteriaceae bacterium]|nr:hypothetical protein [Flavobacteriaceae bacterium]
MRVPFILSILLLVAQSSFSQVDNTSKKKTIVIDAKVIPTKKAKKLDVKSDEGFKNAYKKEQKKKTLQQIEDELLRKGILTRTMLANQRLKAKFEKNNAEIPMVDKDLGSFHTKSKNINILCYDFGIVDGDVVTIYKNGVAIVKNYVLDSKYRVFKIPLTIGFNRIDIVAVHEGRLRPNTANFSVYDDKNKVVTSDFWHLAKGAKVTAMIIRDKE